MTMAELRELEELLVEVEESNDKIDPIESVYFWYLKRYREQAPKKLGDEFNKEL